MRRQRLGGHAASASCRAPPPCLPLPSLPRARAVDETVPGLPGVVMTRQGPLAAYTARLREVLNEAGEALGAAGACRDWV